MTDSLGLSIGMTNLVAAREGRPPVLRRSILTLFNDRAPVVGDYPGHGLALTGFVDRVGDPVPIVAADGSQHRGELVLAEALDAMARTVDGGAPITIAVPAYWGPGAVGALRGALRNKPSLAPDGVPATLVPDSLTALAALRANPGLPADGVVVLCDFGGSGTSVTLADAGADFATIGQTVRFPEFSGDQIDQSLLNHVIAGVAAAGNADPAGTAAVGSLARLRDECRQAKERLSAETTAVVPVDLPGFTSDVRVTRPELEQLVAEPLSGLLSTIEDTLQRNNIPQSSIAAVATVGGGAAIPVVTQRLSERLQAPVVTAPLPQFVAAAGAAVVADRVAEAGAPTGMAPGIVAADAPTGMAPGITAADAPTGLAPGLSGADAPTGMAPGADPSNFSALAWSQDDVPTEEPVPYAGADYSSDYADAATGATAARPPIAFTHDEETFEAEPGPLPWYKRPPILFGAAAAAVLLAAGGLAVTLTSGPGDSTPVTETSTTYSMGSSPEGPPPEPITTVTVGPDGQGTTTVVVPPPPPPSSTTTTESTTSPTTTTTTTTTTSTTTTTTTPTTTTTRTTTTTTQPPTTTKPPTTTQPPVTTTVEVPDNSGEGA